MSGRGASGHLEFHGDKQLTAGLAALNEQLSRFVVRLLNADAGRAAPVSVADERALAHALRAMAGQLQDRADRHAALTGKPTPEGDAPSRRSIGSRPSERCQL